MGNSISNEFINLEDEKKEKSIFSFKVYFVEKSVNNGGIETNEQFKIKMKLKLYPSTLTIKNEFFKKDFSYYDILCWTTSKKFFGFSCKKESYYFLTRKDIEAEDISKALKGICLDLKKTKIYYKDIK